MEIQGIIDCEREDGCDIVNATSLSYHLFCVFVVDVNKSHLSIEYPIRSPVDSIVLVESASIHFKRRRVLHTREDTDYSSIRIR